MLMPNFLAACVRLRAAAEVADVATWRTLRRELGDESMQVALADMAELGRNPARGASDCRG